MKTQFKVIMGVGALVLASNASAVLVVTASDDGTTLANAILGSGVTISNVVYYDGANVSQSGLFTDGLSAGLGFDSGIILTSGQATDAVGPNSSDGISVETGSGSDTDLDALIPQPNTFDVAYLQFDFTSTSGDLFFNWAFASEEYNEFVNSQFNDVFAFFVDGVNIALAPDGQVASVNTINCGNPLSGIGPNCDVFNNNDLNDGGPFFDIEYDGFTNSLVASALGLGVGTHTIKIAIADTSDQILDSGVFIQAGSFSDKPTDVPEPASLALLGLGLFGLGALRKRRLS